MNGKAMYSLLPLGGGNEIGASSYALRAGSEHILLDAGVRIKGARRFPNFSLLTDMWNLDGLWEMSAAVVSHAHLDHTGALPAIIGELGDVPVYSSAATPGLMIAQCDDMSVSGALSYAPEDDPSSLLRRTCTSPAHAAGMMRIVECGKSIDIGSLNMTFFRAGHIPGAVMTLIDDGDHRVLYTGDFCDFDQHTVDGFSVPRMKIDTLICESTYGYHAKSFLGTEYNSRLSYRVNERLRSGRLAECRVRSVGRPAELALAINECMEHGSCPSADIWIDRSCAAGCRAIEQFGGKKIIGTGRIKLYDPYLDGRDIEGIIIHSRSGSFNAGYDDNSNVLYEGDCCLSNHADCSGILTLIARVMPRRVVLVHGTPRDGSFRNVADEARERFGTLVEVIHSVNGQEIAV